MTRLYVGNPLYAALTEDVAMLFTSHGFQPINIDMSTDPFTGRNPSYCFVELTTEDEAERAMQQLAGQPVMGLPVKLNTVTPKRGSSSHQQDSRARIRTYDRNWRGQAAPPSQAQGDPGSPYAFDRWQTPTAASDHWQKPVNEGSRLYIGGLPRIEPQSTAQIEVRKIFDGSTVLAISKMISPHAR